MTAPAENPGCIRCHQPMTVHVMHGRDAVLETSFCMFCDAPASRETEGRSDCGNAAESFVSPEQPGGASGYLRSGVVIRAEPGESPGAFSSNPQLRQGPASVLAGSPIGETSHCHSAHHKQRAVALLGA